MPTIIPFQITPRLPERLKNLIEIAYNIHWSWDHETIALFRRMDLGLWEETRHNPVLMLGRIRQERLDALAKDDSFLAHMDRATESMKSYLSVGSWFDKRYGKTGAPFIAYFSMEFGLTECLPNYSGGLGVLSGDHLKSASDLGVPLVAVGLLYQQGYFHQYLNLDGWQQELYPDNDFYNMPMTLERAADGAPRQVHVDFPGRTVHAQIWRVQIGRVPLYLLDANIPENAPADRNITLQLYGGDVEMRIKQELLIGVGGLRTLKMLGISPAVCHMNEGHSAFLALERVRQDMDEHGVSFWEAFVAARAGNVFTTHTPVPAGIDMFGRDIIERYFAEYARKAGISIDDLMRLGHAVNAQKTDPFNMAIFALHASTHRNAVSRLHGRVARSMWSYDWPQVPLEEIPIGYVTNGVHIHSWVSRDMSDLFERYLGAGWRQEVANPELWRHVEEIPDGELWHTHERRRERLIAFARNALVRQYRRRGLPDSYVALAREALLPDALTLGFARRFATYKRATLLLQDRDRLRRILTDEKRPVQIIFAGKAHPHDTGGKQLIRELTHFAREAKLEHRLIFIEDYDMNVARYLVQGVDVWVNTPRRPLEASGTSGMKIAANGGLNLSVLDGWWDEGHRREAGWSIGYGEEYKDPDLQDRIESEELYNILEREVVPLFYNRTSDDLPRGWIAMMKASLELLCPAFNTDRMLQEYTDRYYVPALQHHNALHDNDVARGKALAAWQNRVQAEWHNVAILSVEADTSRKLHVGQNLPVTVRVALGALTAGDVSVQLYSGELNTDRQISDGAAVPMRCVEQSDPNSLVYTGEVACSTSGLHGFAVRVLPRHDDLFDPLSMHLIC
ncbi:glycosyltransferase family 1 protein, partial [bacterium]|nr:glycosyltransferase family 1 protein [bacterium]